MYKPIDLILICWLLLAGCAPEDKQQKPVISVSILPQQYLVEQIAGDRFQVNVLIPPGASPATYEPTPAQMQQMSESSIYFRMGNLAFEHHYLDRFKQINPQMQVVNSSRGVRLIEGHHGGHDPHTWLSPKQLPKIAENIYQTLSQADTSRSAQYLKNYKQFRHAIDSMDQVLEERFRNLDKRKFIIFHPSLAYLSRDYGLEQVAIEYEGKKPTASVVKQVIDIAREEDIRTILIQDQFPRENAMAIAREIHGEVVQLNPLAYDWLQNMDEMSKKISNALKKDTHD